MPEIGRPITQQQQQYSQVEMGPRSLAGNKNIDPAKLREQIINKATGYKNTKDSIYQQGPHNQMGKDEFLKLMTAQMQHQDPMAPMDQSKLTGELAQFAQLEQLANLNKKWDDQTKTQSMQDKFYAASFVGKKIVTQGSTLDLKNDGDEGDVMFKLDGEASKVMIRILDEKKNVVGEIWKDGMSQGAHQIAWNGITLDGQPAAKGKYTAAVKAWDSLGKEVAANTQATGIVQSVTFDEGEPVLTVNNQKVYLRDVSSFHTAETQTHPVAAPQANNSGLSGHAAPIQFKNTPVQPQQVMNAYSENKGIYD